MTEVYDETCSSGGSEISLCSASASGKWNRQLTTTASGATSYANIAYATRAYIASLDARTSVYAVLEDGSTSYLGQLQQFARNDWGYSNVVVPSSIASRVRGVYISVTGANRDSDHDDYIGSATIYGYLTSWTH